MPVEELLFAAGFGTYQVSGVYEYVIWRKIIPAAEAARRMKGQGKHPGKINGHCSRKGAAPCLAGA
ncbi:MAG: hypothetical protein MZV70_61180 [Desulfobacterales bacterium]|nr:hypothetical protein [Desulfobacterales bacterium]